MKKRNLLWVLCSLIIFLVTVFALIPISPRLYAEDFSQPTEEIIIATMVNNVRNANKVENLCWNETLAQIADVRAQDMINRCYFSHYTPEGTTVFALMKSFGIYKKYRGENLARGRPASCATPEGIINAWMQSESHRNNILRKAYSKIGVGIEVRDKEEKIIVLVFTN
jgi:uncharacterized protein YkwD